jgi:hypothetical protein
MKINPKSKSSAQMLVILGIVVVLLLIGYWWLDSNRQTMAKSGKEFGKEAVQRIAVQHDLNFFGSHLSPEARLQFPPSAQQDLLTRIEKLGAPVGPVDVQGDVVFQSHFFEPHGNFHARINYAARGAEINVSISHPVGRWQIDDVAFLADPER